MKLFSNIPSLCLFKYTRFEVRRKNIIAHKNFRQALPEGAETKAIWWEKCSELTHGFNKILLVGPVGSGKTTLVRIMVSINGKS